MVSIIVRLSSWRWADRAHPWVRRWGVPLFCVAVGLPSVLDPAGDSAVAEELALTIAVVVPLVWRERRPMLVFALITATAVLTTYAGSLHGDSASADVARVVALFNVGRFGTPASCSSPSPSPWRSWSPGPPGSGATVSWSTPHARNRSCCWGR